MRRVAGLSRMWLGLLVALGVVVCVAVVAAVAAFSGGDDGKAASPTTSSGSKVKVVVAGTNDALEEVVDGGITGEGNFRASGAITDKGTARGYRALSVGNEKVILLRYVT